MNHLFPSKVLSLFQAIQNTTKYSAMTKSVFEVNLPLPEDGLNRISLNTPSMKSTILDDYSLKIVRVRLVFPKELSLSTMRGKILEIYDCSTTKPVLKSLTIEEMSKPLALALETELLYLIAIDKGVHIEMM